MNVRIISVDEDADVEKTSIAFIVLFEDLDKSRMMLTTVSNNAFFQPKDV